MGWFGKESPLFGRQSKLGGAGNAQHPDAEFNAIPNWSARNQYLKDQELMDEATGNYYRVTRTDYSSDSVATDVGSGLLVPMIAAPSPGITSVKYANAAFVDAIAGDDSTGLIGRFDRPFKNIINAMSAMAAASPSLTKRGLVWIRKADYSASFTMLNHIDVYCEPGVVFTSGQISIGDVNTNLYGYAKFNVSDTCMLFGGKTQGTFQFTSIDSASTAIIFNTSAGGDVVIKCDYISTGILASLGITVRGNVNLTMDVKRQISGFSEVFNFRFYSGRTIINCPRIKLLTGDTFGGDFKSAVKMYECTGAIITVNGDLYNEDPTYYMGISGMVVFWNGPTVNFTLNGNIEGRGCPAIGLYNGAVKCSINGNMSSDTRLIYSASGEMAVKQSSMNLSNLSSTNPIFLEESAKVNLIDCHIFNDLVDSDTITINAVSTVDLNLYGCIGEQSGTGDFLASVDPISVRIVNTMATHALGASVTNLIGSNGFFQDANVKAIQF